MKKIIRLTESELRKMITEAINEAMVVVPVSIRDLAYDAKKFVGTNYDDFERGLRRNHLDFVLADSYFTGDGKVIATLKNDNDDCIYVEVEWDGYHAGKILYIETKLSRKTKIENRLGGDDINGNAI